MRRTFLECKPKKPSAERNMVAHRAASSGRRDFRPALSPEARSLL
jgi:hypothetical protein